MCHLERTGSILTFTTTKKGEVNGANRNLQVKKAVNLLLQRMIGMKMLQRVISTRHQWSRMVMMKPAYLNHLFVILIVRIFPLTFLGSKLKTIVAKKCQFSHNNHAVHPGFHVVDIERSAVGVEQENLVVPDYCTTRVNV